MNVSFCLAHLTWTGDQPFHFVGNLDGIILWENMKTLVASISPF